VNGARGKGEGRVAVLAGEVAEDTVTIAAGGALTGLVRVFPGGAPAAGLDCHGLAPAHATTASDGSFTLADVPPGAQRVSCESPGGATQRRGGASFALTEGGSARVEVWVVDVDTQRIESEREVADLGADLVPAAGATVALANVTPGGPAARAGLQAGDVVVLVDGADATGTRAAAVDAYVDARVPGAHVSFVVRRGTAQVTANVTLGARAY
jgi:membrane-associated protease RseP (regulator of RpoE activity)